MNEDIKKQENAHLKEIIERISHSRKKAQKELEVIGKENLNKLIDIRENETGSDFEYFIYQLGEKNDINLKDKFARMEELIFSEKEPYFARIDLRSTKNDDKRISSYYIGKFGYTDKEPLVIDWRAKISSVYYRYRYPQNNIYYDTPKGREFRDLVLKRTYEIENSILYKYYNNDIQLDESAVVADKIAKRTGGVLEDIVSTIQLSQLDIIESDPRQVCIVQGCVGSGKSTVAIHKLAHIFFNYPNIIRSSRTILLAKNQILAGYLSTLFPKLGIFDLNFKTLRDLVYNVVFREELGLDIDLAKGEYTGSFDLENIKDLHNRVDKIHQDIEDKIEKLFNNSEYITFKSNKYSRSMTPYENISEILTDLEEELASEKSYMKKNPNSQRLLLFKENIKALRKLIDKLNKLRNEIKDKVLEKETEYYGVHKNNKLTYCDLLIYLYLYMEIIGLRSFLKYEYCVVDEAQDFSLLEYLVVSKLVIRGRFAVFGDLNQIMEKDGIKNWADLEKVILEAKKASVFELDTNYRSTKDIINIARKIMEPYTKKYLPKSINRNGSEPKIVKFNQRKQLIEYFTDGISQDLNQMNKSVGIICMDSKYIDVVKDILKSINSKQEIKILNEDNKIRYTPVGVYLSDVQNCKGLEFSKVYILGLNIDKIDNEEDARKSFVAVTRAMNDLVILGVK